MSRSPNKQSGRHDPFVIVYYTIDRKVLRFIKRRSGRVSVRELMRGPASCRSLEGAEAAIQTLMAAGMGGWVVGRGGKLGGRPSRVFELNGYGSSCTDGSTPPKARRPMGKPTLKQIARGIVHYLNRYSRVSCDDLVLAVTEAGRLLSGVGKNEDKDLLSICPRTIRVSKRGSVRTTWESR